MTKTNLKIKLSPKYIQYKNGLVKGSSLSSGYDLPADINEDWQLEPGSTIIVPTGIYMQLDPGFEGQVRSRSGLAAKKGVFVLNSPGTIDADYTGEVKVILHNNSNSIFTISPGDRIAQLVITELPVVSIDYVNELNETERGEGGFGSTGVK